MAATVHIIGAGLSGLSSAVHLVGNGWRVVVYEGAAHAGGRCRSFFDASLDRSIDNGNHLLLSGNTSAKRYLRKIGANDTFVEPGRAEYPFVDLRSGERWTVRPDCGAVPWSLLLSKNRIPGSGLGDYLRGLRLARAGKTATVEHQLADTGVLFERFWEPLAVSVLNTPAAEASASLLWPVIRETFGRGEAACRPMIAKKGLSDALVDPAVDHIRDNGGEIRFGARVTALQPGTDRIAGLTAADEEVVLGAGDAVVLAVPPPAVRSLLPRLTVPDDFEPIVNGHFRLPDSARAFSFLCLVGGVCHWLFVRDDIASVTVSAARDLVTQSGDDIARRVWADVCSALDLGETPLAHFRIIKEKRATFSQTPAQVARRPGPKTEYGNLWVAGDWTDTGLPATIEGSIRSGEVIAAEIGRNA